MTEKEIARWWDEASEYYQKEIADDKLDTVHYGPFGSTEEKLRLLGNVKGKIVLELGCGGGQCAISLTKKGAICTGIDVSAKQLEYAAKLANARLNEMGKIMCDERDARFEFMEKEYAGDNGAMIAYTGYLMRDYVQDDLSPRPDFRTDVVEIKYR